MKPTKLLDVSTLTDKQLQNVWEDAYVRFETTEEEIKKFIGRLNRLGQKNWRRDEKIVDIFCGRGNGLKALEILGFTNLEGVDISPELLSRYQGSAKLYAADCRELPFEDSSRDIIIVQGGLHHLPTLPEDLKKTLSEVMRVLRPGGKFVMVEPFSTPFLQMIHFLSEYYIVKLVSNKFDAFAAMTHYEATTYFNWLSKSFEIPKFLDEFFVSDFSQKRFGKLFYVGHKQVE